MIRIFVLLCLLSTAALAQTPTPAPQAASTEERIVMLVNQERARHGCRPLILDRSLANSCQHHAGIMARLRSMHHAQNAGYENVAMGQQSAEEVMRCWMNSSGHRANILNPNHRVLGIGYAWSGRHFWCQRFR